MALSEELKERIRAEFPKYPEKRAVLLTALHWAQAEHGGWIPAEIEPEIAELIEIPLIEVHEVVSFYSLFHSDPVGRFHLQVCVNLSCCLRGARNIVRSLEDLLAIRSGEVTEDGLFSIGEVQCLGSCGTAPVLQVNNQPFLEGLTREGLAEILDRLRASAASSGNGGSPSA
jgi:NADH-quinone oxidoreductase E subunit